uniref:Major facilitator superfamily (MFS) profile domain-containing protein n=1 Tax=Parascaris equorum TaxID=6256 RepID=A0A914RGU4_PAREQ
MLFAPVCGYLGDRFNRKLIMGVGFGLGYMVGSYVSMWAGAWEWGIRMTPILGLICIILILFVLDDPIRGNADVAFVENSSFIDDIKYLFKM